MRNLRSAPISLVRSHSGPQLMFEDYLDERQAEVKFLQSVRRNALNALYSGMSSLTIDVPKLDKDEFVAEEKKRKK